jgi:hypothetical protein
MTVMSTAPVPAGEVTVICVLVSDVIVAAVLPKFTAIAPTKFVPVIITEVPPAVEPEAGEMPDTVGTGVGVGVAVTVGVAVGVDVGEGVGVGVAVTVGVAVGVDVGEGVGVGVAVTVGVGVSANAGYPAIKIQSKTNTRYKIELLFMTLHLRQFPLQHSNCFSVLFNAQTE